MTPSQKSPKSHNPSATDKRLDDHAPTDWQMRKGEERYPFDIIILTQTPIESELDILFDHGGEPAAKYRGDARIYRLKDGRFAVMALTTDCLNSPPEHLEFWNWWARTTTPSFQDLTQAREIGHKIEQLKFMSQDEASSLPPL